MIQTAKQLMSLPFYEDTSYEDFYHKLNDLSRFEQIVK